MKRILALLISTMMVCALLSGCSDLLPPDNTKKTIVCTIFPQYDWVMNILGDKADDYNVILLVKNGSDMHSYQPSAKDIVTISTCDLFIYVGGESDAWVNDVLADATNKNLLTLNMLASIGDLAHEEELVEGMDGSGHSHEHIQDDEVNVKARDDSPGEVQCYDEIIHDEHNDELAHNTHVDELVHDEHGDEPEYDEHVWLSLNNASVICEAITDKLCALSPNASDTYKTNFEAYNKSLTSLNKEFESITQNATRNVLLFGDRFPFRYFVEDYNLEYYAAFPGCSAETEASFHTLVFLSEKIDELSLPAICVTESSDKKVAETIVNNTINSNEQIVVFDSIQSVTADDIEDGVSYLSLMRKNLEALKLALY